MIWKPSRHLIFVLQMHPLTHMSFISKWSHQTPGHPCWNLRFFFLPISVHPAVPFMKRCFIYHLPFIAIYNRPNPLQSSVPLCPSSTLLPSDAYHQGAITAITVHIGICAYCTPGTVLTALSLSFHSLLVKFLVTLFTNWIKLQVYYIV